MERWKLRMMKRPGDALPINPNNQFCGNCKLARNPPEYVKTRALICGKTLKLTFASIIGEDHCWQKGDNHEPKKEKEGPEAKDQNQGK